MYLYRYVLFQIYLIILQRPSALFDATIQPQKNQMLIGYEIDDYS